MLSVYNLFNYQVGYVPDKTAIIYDGKTFTYRSLSEKICELAVGLRKIGIRKGSHVGYLFNNCIECVEIFYACQKIGAVAIPFNFRLIGSDIGKLIELTDIDCFIFGPKHRDVYEAAKEFVKHEYTCVYAGDDLHDNEIAFSSLFLHGTEDRHIAEPATQDTALMLFTGGTTGLSKAAMLSGEAIFLKSVMHLTDKNDFDRNSVMMCYSPLFHVAGMTYLLYLMALGGTLLLAGTFDPEITLSQIEEYKITHIFLIPPNLCSLLKASPSYGKKDLSSIRCVIMSGAKNFPDLVREVYEMFPQTSVSNTYGHTESVADTILYLSREEFEANPNLVETVGKETKGSEIRLLDDNGNEVPVGESGVVWARNPAQMTGFYKREDVFVNGWYNTGDIMMKDEDGYFHFLDRAKDMVKTGGENVYCLEVETVIRQHPAVFECAVFGVPDLKFSEAVAAAVSFKPGMSATAEELTEHCKKNMASYKKPKHFYFMDSIPKTTTGKINKVALREMYSK